MKKNEKKITWYHALFLGLSQIADGLVSIVTLGSVEGEFTLDTLAKIGKWRVKYKEKKWR